MILGQNVLYNFKNKSLKKKELDFMKTKLKFPLSLVF